MSPLVVGVSVHEGNEANDQVTVTFGDMTVGSILCPCNRGRELAALLLPDDGKTIRESGSGSYHRWVET